MTSTDGFNWTPQTLASDNNWNGIAYGNGLFVVICGGINEPELITSPTGEAWTQHKGLIAQQWNAIAYGNGVFVAVAPQAGFPGLRAMSSGILGLAP